MICVSVQEKSLEACLKILEKAPMAELRADLCKLTLPELEKVVESHPNLIITCRIANSSEEFAREQIITAIRKGARYVDIEIEAPVDFLEYVKTYAQVNGAKVIISYHNYEGTQSIGELQLIADICRRKGADIVKIVTTAHNISDAVRTLSLYRNGNWAREFKTNNYSIEKDVMLLAFSMGKAGQFSRYLSLKLGAPYTYVAYGGSADDSGICGAATAPGQYTMAEMESLLSEGKIKLDYKFTKKETFIPCSKSVAQRAILAAAFAKGITRLSNFEPCNDINGAVEVIKQFGCSISYPQDGVIEIGSGGVEYIKELFIGNCSQFDIRTGESGLLTRLLVPFAAFLTTSADVAGIGGSKVNIIGDGSIMGRNLGSAANAIIAAGASCKSRDNGYLPFEIEGKISGGNISISGKESSQIVSGFLMMLPMLSSDTMLTVENPASIPYIELTLAVLEQFGISIGLEESSADRMVFSIKGNQSYKASSLYLEPDWSSAAFFAVGYSIASLSDSSQYLLRDMKVGTRQADEAVLEVLEMAGVEVEVLPSAAGNGLVDISLQAPRSLEQFDFDATDAPDLFPILTVLALFCNGRSSIKGAGRLLEKESNRAESIFTEFTAMGADLEIVDDYLYINGNIEPFCTLQQGICNLHSHNDHRIAMSLIIASMFVGKEICIDELKCIDKSFPSFLSHL